MCKAPNQVFLLSFPGTLIQKGVGETQIVRWIVACFYHPSLERSSRNGTHCWSVCDLCVISELCHGSSSDYPFFFFLVFFPRAFVLQIRSEDLVTLAVAMPKPPALQTEVILAFRKLYVNSPFSCYAPELSRSPGLESGLTLLIDKIQTQNNFCLWIWRRVMLWLYSCCWRMQERWIWWW